MSVEKSKQDTQLITKFVAEEPKAKYLIDGNDKSSFICRVSSLGDKKCINLPLSSKELFGKMRDLEYFCSLTTDINRTDFECFKI